jgi:hypothetical protein
MHADLQAFLRICAAALVTGLGTASADTLYLSSGQKVEGFLVTYDHGEFTVVSPQGKSSEYKASAVRRIQLTKPLKGTITPRGGKTIEGATLEGFEGGAFKYEANGQKMTRPFTMVREIRLEVKIEESLGELGVTVISRGEEVEIRAKLSTGRVNIVHFHAPSVASSMRQGGYIARLARESGGKIAALRIDVGDPSAPVLQQYQVRSIPQFWLYNAQGEPADKLVDRFTEEDIDAAIRRAQTPSAKTR